MADVVSKEARSKIMASIHSRNTKPELALKKAIWGRGFIYQPKTKGSPDFIHRENKIAIFVHGCFWHKCPQHYRVPKSNQKYWLPKLERNVVRDRENKKMLREKGYKIMTLWEHELKRGAEKALGKIK